MEQIDLKVQLREETGKGPAHRCRQKGLIPGVFYGPKVDSIPLVITQAEFKKALKGKMGENIIINLTVEGKEDLGSQIAMIHDFQIDLIKRDVIHIDLKKIDLEKKVTVAVPIELTGKSEGVKLGGILEQVERELEIRCMPLAIPDRFEVDVTSLMKGESIHVRDIKVPEGIEVITSREQTVVTILSPKEEKVAAGEAAEEVEAAPAKEDKTKGSEAK